MKSNLRASQAEADTSVDGADAGTEGFACGAVRKAAEEGECFDTQGKVDLPVGAVAQGGFRIGEAGFHAVPIVGDLEVAALEGFGVAVVAQEAGNAPTAAQRDVELGVDLGEVVGLRVVAGVEVDGKVVGAAYPPEVSDSEEAAGVGIEEGLHIQPEAGGGPPHHARGKR